MCASFFLYPPVPPSKTLLPVRRVLAARRVMCGLCWRRAGHLPDRHRTDPIPQKASGHITENGCWAETRQEPRPQVIRSAVFSCPAVFTVCLPSVSPADPRLQEDKDIFLLFCFLRRGRQGGDSAPS